MGDRPILITHGTGKSACYVFHGWGTAWTFKIVKEVVAVIGPLAGVALGSWLSRGNAKKLKLSEMRREAYGVILSGLATIERHLDWADEMIQDDHMHFYEGTGYGSINTAIAPSQPARDCPFEGRSASQGQVPVELQSDAFHRERTRHKSR